MDTYGILMEILSRVPLKSLLRFRCVSKEWNTLISSRHLRKLHRKRYNSNPPLIIASYTTIPEHVSPSDPDPCCNTYLVTYNLEGKIVEQIIPPFPLKYLRTTNTPYQSKLMCFYQYLVPKEFYLYNPSTRQSFLLTNPYPLSSGFLRYPENPNNLRNFCKFHITAALGYFHSKDEYIMVHLVKSNGKLLCEALNISISDDDNFSLHYDDWRSIDTKDIRIKEARGGSGVFVAGSFYWQVFDDPNFPFILSLDVEREHFSILDCPERLSSNANLLEIYGELYVSNLRGGCPTNLILWKLCCEKKSWAVHWKFDFERSFGFTTHQHLYGSGFRPDIFIYHLKYLMGYEEQPRDDQVSAEMWKLSLPDMADKIIPVSWTGISVHTNLFTL